MCETSRTTESSARCGVALSGEKGQASSIPVLAEVDDTLTLAPEDIERQITPRTKAVMVVHTGGVAADMDAILGIARRRGLAVIEDCAQSAGARFRGRRIGSLGDVGAFSLQIHKTFTSGEGGAVTTNDETIFERAVAYHDLGVPQPQFEIDHPRLTPGFGDNYRMSDLTAAVALVQLRKLESAVLAPLQAHKAYLRGALRNEPGIQLRRRPDEPGDAGTSLAFFAPTAECAAWMSEALTAENIPVSRPYGGKVLYQAWPSHFAFETDASRRTTQHLMPQLASVEYHEGMCPRTEELIARSLILNLTPVLTDRDLDDAVIAIRKVARAAVKS